MFQLSDILGEVEDLKVDPKYDITMSHFDSSVRISPIALSCHKIFKRSGQPELIISRRHTV